MISWACKQSRDLHGSFLAASRRPRNRSRFRNVRGHGKDTPPSSLNPLGNRINQRGLLAGVLVEQFVQLQERGAGHLPMMLLVHVAERDTVGQHLIQILTTCAAFLFAERERHLHHVTVLLNLMSLLAGDRGSPARIFDRRHRELLKYL